VSTQAESRHFFMPGDTVRHQGGALGTVREALTLYAVIAWEDGREEEVEQLDFRIEVLERAARE
jgi:hypothetical protein